MDGPETSTADPRAAVAPSLPRATEGDEAPSEALAAAACRGDRRALARLLDRHADEAFRVALRLSGSEADAEEVVQGALERVLRHVCRYDPSRPFRPWLMRIVVNQARSHWRRRRLKELLLGLEPLDATMRATGADPDGDLSRKELRAVLEQAVATLPRDQREAFVLKHVEGYSYEEISEVTGASVGSLRVRAHRARAAVLAYCRAQGVTRSGCAG